MRLQQLLPLKLVDTLRKQKYKLVGRHSAVKKCRWLHQSLVYGRSCYKQQFYGIKSHRCIQMTPTIAYCTMRCKFCWRVQPDDIDIRFDETTMTEYDDPETIVEGCIRAQHQILSGYKTHPKVDAKEYIEALNPKHAAISLAGEPTLYPNLGELVRLFHRREFTTFIVTNGTVPEVLGNLSREPTQLYVSVCAPNEKIFTNLCRPQVPNAWQKLNESLELLHSFKCPTVIRLTLVRHFNLKKSEEYAKLIEKANPTYVEPKAYVHVGFSRKRLKYENMPTHEDIRAFAKQLSRESGYKILDEAKASRVVLLSRLESPVKLA